jgi:hypothetical protein
MDGLINGLEWMDLTSELVGAKRQETVVRWI